MPNNPPGRPADYPVTVPAPEQAPHIIRQDAGPMRDLAIQELREVQALRALLRQKFEDLGHGAIKNIATEAGVTPQWIGRLLRWRAEAPKFGERPPQSVSLAKLRAVSEASGGSFMRVLEGVIDAPPGRALPGEGFMEYLRRVGALQEHLDADEHQLLTLFRQIKAEHRQRFLWQLRGVLERTPAAGEPACKWCGGRITAADYKRWSGICLECSVPAGVIDVGPPGSIRPLRLGADNTTKRRTTRRTKRGGDTSGNGS
jgi:hypothetical protein